MPAKMNCHSALVRQDVDESSSAVSGLGEQRQISHATSTDAKMNATSDDVSAMRDIPTNMVLAGGSRESKNDTSKQMNGNSSKMSSREDKKRKKKSKSDVIDNNGEQAGLKAPKSKNVAEELKIFQNSNLLNQQDPLEQLQQQLNQLILDDVSVTQDRTGLNVQQNNIDTRHQHPAHNQSVATNQASLSLQSTQIYPHGMHPIDCNVSPDMFTVKKGVLWQQQDFDKFHQKLFSRWKKRFFILTTDYLVCFKRSTSKVGRSEMGKFLYKTSLGDILNVEWLRPKKSDKGAIILRMRNKFNLFLWSKENLDEWMTLIESMRLKRKLRGSPTGGLNRASNQNGIYENAVRDGLLCQTTSCGNTDLGSMPNGSMNQDQATRQHVLNASSEQITKATSALQVTSSSEQFNQGLIERTNQYGHQQQQTHETGANNVAPRHESVVQTGKIGTPMSQRPLTNMINDDDGAAAPVHGEPSEREKQNLSSDDVTLASVGAHQADNRPQDQSAARKDSSSASSTSRSSNAHEKRVVDESHDSCELRTENTNEKKTICRDSNDNLVLSGSTKSKHELAELPIGETRTSAKWQFGNNSESRDKRHMEPNGSNEWTQNKQMVAELLQQARPDATKQGRSRLESETVGQRAEGQPVKLERPSTNLIRRDDSWHSLSSLNQIGSNLQMQAKRSLYAQHIMPTTGNDGHSRLAQDNDGRDEPFKQHSRINNLESTATPLRGRPLIRQQSMQVHNNKRSPSTRDQQQAASFDVAQIPGSPSQHFSNQHQQPPTSYHQKLLQLQLLHNSNNIDYVRNNVGHNNVGDRSTNNDYQIYGPGSIATTNHYGYYSMRSNLKSAASEFSFIRPTSSDFHPSGRSAIQQQQQQHSGHPSNFTANMDQSQDFDINRTSLAMAQQQSLNYENANNLPSSSSRSQYLSKDHSTNGQQFSKPQQALNGHATNLMAPNRDLPLKPNKKRQQLAGAMEAQSQKGSSTTFGSSIVHFFRRAFSKRSKRRPKLAESCSSSLGGAFDEKFESIQRTRSAFSTSEGMRAADRIIEGTDQQQQSALQQRQRMIDMIEAFANKTAIDQETYNKLLQQNRTDSAQYLSAMRTSIQNDVSAPVKPSNYNHQQFVGSSPLHKSNSISTSTGLSGLNEMMRLNERQMLLNGPNSPAIRASQRNGAGPMSSPMVTRSTKVMSAHLTPLFNRKEAHEYEGAYFVSSPRHSTNFEHLPRPSSIYGQPSMISSPVASNVRDHTGNEFGAHRSSIHSYHQRPNRSSLNPNMDFRRNHHQTTSKAPFLDTTREVAEEVSSPTTESKALLSHESMVDRHQALDDYDETIRETTTPMNYPLRHQQQQRRNIVNPILQSPTMSLIYDNHPVRASGGSGAYSHYDNHRPIEYQQSMSSMDLSSHSHPQSLQQNNLDAIENRYHRTNITDCNAVVSPLVSSRNSKLRQSYNIGTNHVSDLATPTRLSQQQQQLSSDGCYPSNVDRNVSGYAKQSAAMIVPDTPMSRRASETSTALPYTASNSGSITDSPVISQYNPYSRANPRPSSIVNLSPNKPTQQPHSHYQRSPLVNRLTRVAKRSDGVQTTVIHPEVSAHNSQQEAVVNIVGAPGINLEPSLAHSLLRGTNINAFESSAAGLNSISNRANANTKTFLVSSRLSKTINESPSPNAGSNIGRRIDRAVLDSSNREIEHEHSRGDEASSRSTSSGTDPISTSSSDRGARKKVTHDSETKSCDDRGNRDNSVNTNRKESQSRSSNNSSRRRGSSTEHSDELSSQAESFDEPPPEERKWVTSKLIQ